MRARPAALVLAAALALALLAAGCIARHAKEEIYREGPVEVYLRSDVRGTTPVEKGYAHPVAIAPVRIAHILASLDVAPRGSDERLPAVPTELLFAVAQGVSEALAQADPSQEVAVRAIRETKRWGLFDHDYLTSFVVYAQEGRLHVHLSHHDWEIPRRRERLPEPGVDVRPQRFELRPAAAMTRLNAHSVAADWRDPVFERPARVEVQPDGEVVRKRILLESPPEAGAPAPARQPLPGDLSPEQLRALADLEQGRREGRIPEAAYEARRREILGGS